MASLDYALYIVPKIAGGPPRLLFLHTLPVWPLLQSIPQLPALPPGNSNPRFSVFRQYPPALISAEHKNMPRLSKDRILGEFDLISVLIKKTFHFSPSLRIRKYCYAPCFIIWVKKIHYPARICITSKKRWTLNIRGHRLLVLPVKFPCFLYAVFLLQFPGHKSFRKFFEG